jgi:hypothetical protein
VSSYCSTGASIFARARACHVPCASSVHNTCTCKARAQNWHLGKVLAFLSYLLVRSRVFAGVSAKYFTENMILTSKTCCALLFITKILT